MIDPRERWTAWTDACWLAREPVLVGTAHRGQPCNHPMCRNAGGGSNLPKGT